MTSYASRRWVAFVSGAVVSLLVVAGCRADDSASSFSPPPEWSEGAVRRLRDVLYASDPPTFVAAGSPDPIAVVEAGVLLDAIGRSVSTITLSELAALETATPVDELMLADEFLRLEGELTNDDRTYIRSLVERTTDVDQYTAATRDRLRAAVGLEIPADVDCPRTVPTLTLLYEAGAIAERVRLRQISCPLVADIPAPPASEVLTAELVEYVRALNSLAAAGMFPTERTREASTQLVAAVERALSIERPSRSFAQLLHHALTADPDVADAISSDGADIADWSERTMRWLGSLPDSVEGVDYESTAIALRSASRLDPESVEALQSGSFAQDASSAARPVGFDAFVRLALGRPPVSSTSLEDLAGLPTGIALPIAGRHASCAHADGVAAAARQSAARDPIIAGVLAAVGSRCARPVGDLVDRTSDDVVAAAANECMVENRVSSETAKSARNEIGELEWAWAPNAVPDLSDLYRRIVLLDLQDRSCLGFWWWADP